MKKLTAILIALGASAGIAFGKIVYEDTLLSAANPDQFAQSVTVINDQREEADRLSVADDLLVEQLNHRVAHQLDKITRELDHKISLKMTTPAL